MEIIHFSDLHFGSEDFPFDPSEMAISVIRFIEEKCLEPTLVISGDITFQGKEKGFGESGFFFDKLLESPKIKREKIIACPGNHDIVNKSFDDFDRWIYSLRRDSLLGFTERSVNVLEVGSCMFVLINTSYHLDHTYGMVNEKELVEEIKNKGKKVVVIFHHHVLGLFRDDSSAIRNAYYLVKWLEKVQADLVIHGHQHAEQEYKIGNNATPVFSVRSSNFLQVGHLNAFNTYSHNGHCLETKSYVFEKNGAREVRIREVG
ncbi:metallophosphoesterase [Billgrantia azerbaijanica]|nr:metallophosphoesterase [Halomonas azerbaijanica]